MAAPKVRIYELSKELGVPNKDIMTLLEKEFGLELKSHSSSIDQSVADKVAAILKKRKSPTAASLDTQTPRSASESKTVPPSKEPPPPQLPSNIHSINVIKRATVEAAKEAAKPAEPTRPEPPKYGIPSPPAITVNSITVRKAEPPKVTEPEKPVESVVKAPEPEKPVEKPQAPVTPPVSKAVPPSPPVTQPTQVDRQPQADRPPVNRPMTDRPPMDRQPGIAKPISTAPRHETPGMKRPHQTVAATTAPPTNAPPRTGRPSDGRHPGKTTRHEPHRPDTSHGGGGSSRKDKDKDKAVATKVAVEAPPVEEGPKIVKIHEPLTVSELAQRLNLRETEIIKHLFMKGAMVTVNQTLDTNYAKTVAQEFGFEIEEQVHPALAKGEYNPALLEKKNQIDATKFKHLQQRSPVISIMGHVDHGKTSLLDAIRETRHKIVDTEAGGITQSIGAYTVEKNGQHIVFLDTPGHAAFTSMRMRGAKATDIAILVVAADDGVMPQTIEAINHAKAASIPIIVAVNKIDKPGADPDKVLVQLSEHGLVSEKWGGDTVTVEVSALQKLGLDDLLEMILLVSELLELKADSTVAGEGVIIEAQLDKRKGPIATALVQNGTLKVGDNVMIGPVGGRVRALISDTGERAHKAGPSTPVEILGLSEVPRAGDHFQVVRDEKKFKQMLANARLEDREQRLSSRNLTPGFAQMGPRADGTEAAEQHEFNVIVKADTQGSAEAVNGALARMSTDEIKVKILHTGTGDISEADVMLATASHAIIIGFNVKEDGNASRVAEQSGVKIYKYDVIYHINEEIEKLMLGKLSPDTTEVEAGQAEVRQLFTVGKTTVIAGCMVTKGKVLRNAKAKVTRNGKEIFAGIVDHLKRFKEDAREVSSGYECGISFNKFNDLEIGDVITIFTVEETERTSL